MTNTVTDTPQVGRCRDRGAGFDAGWVKEPLEASGNEIGMPDFIRAFDLKKEYLHNPETQYRIYQSRENPKIQLFVVTTRKEFFVDIGHPERWENHAKGWLKITHERMQNLLEYSIKADSKIVDILYATVTADFVSIVTRYYAPSDGWYPAVVIPKFACLYTKEEIKKSAELFSRMVLDEKKMSTFIELYRNAWYEMVLATGYSFCDVSPNNVLVNEACSDIRIIDVLSINCQLSTDVVSLNFSNLLMGRPLRFDPAPLISSLVIDEDTGERYFNPKNITALRENMKNYFFDTQKSDNRDYVSYLKLIPV